MALGKTDPEFHESELREGAAWCKGAVEDRGASSKIGIEKGLPLTKSPVKLRLLLENTPLASVAEERESRAFERGLENHWWLANHEHGKPAQLWAKSTISTPG